MQISSSLRHAPSQRPQRLSISLCSSIAQHSMVLPSFPHCSSPPPSLLILPLSALLTFYVDIMGALSKSLAGQASLFTSRDHHNLVRARNLRRMSFAIWSGSVDQYATTLPTIQEKLVEALKTAHASVLRIPPSLPVTLPLTSLLLSLSCNLLVPRFDMCPT